MTKSSIKSALRPKAKRAEIIRLASEGWLPSPVHKSCSLADYDALVAEAEKTVPQIPKPFRIPDLEKATGPFCSPGLISGRNSGIINTVDEESIMSEVTEMNGDFENSELFNQLPEELKEFFENVNMHHYLLKDVPSGATIEYKTISNLIKSYEPKEKGNTYLMPGVMVTLVINGQDGKSI